MWMQVYSYIAEQTNLHVDCYKIWSLTRPTPTFQIDPLQPESIIRYYKSYNIIAKIRLYSYSMYPKLVEGCFDATQLLLGSFKINQLILN